MKSLDDAKKHVNKYEEDQLCSGSIAQERFAIRHVLSKPQVITVGIPVYTTEPQIISTVFPIQMLEESL